jgi:hypothetical protein
MRVLVARVAKLWGWDLVGELTLLYFIFITINGATLPLLSSRAYLVPVRSLHLVPRTLAPSTVFTPISDKSIQNYSLYFELVDASRWRQSVACDM